MFDRAELEAVRQWRFKPAFRDGAPSDSRQFRVGFG
ncbi:energy transducer TonB [Methylobacter luteus]